MEPVLLQYERKTLKYFVNKAIYFTVFVVSISTIMAYSINAVKRLFDYFGVSNFFIEKMYVFIFFYLGMILFLFVSFILHLFGFEASPLMGTLSIRQNSVEIIEKKEQTIPLNRIKQVVLKETIKNIEHNRYFEKVYSYELFINEKRYVLSNDISGMVLNNLLDIFKCWQQNDIQFEHKTVNIYPNI